MMTPSSTRPLLAAIPAISVCCVISPSVCLGEAASDRESQFLPKELARRQGDNRPQRQYETGFFGRPLTIGGEYEFNPETRRNLGLAAADEDELTRVEQKLEIEAFFDAGHNWYAFAEAKLKMRQDIRNDRNDERETALERGEMWIYYYLPRYHFGIQVGRQNFKDKREWFWDADLDAIRLRYERGAWRGEFAVARELDGVSAQQKLAPEDESVTRLIGTWQWRWADRQTFDLFWLSQSDSSATPVSGQIFSRDDQDDSDADLDWIGFRARGTFKIRPVGRFYYWADFAEVSGDERLVDFDGTPEGLRIVDDVDDLAVNGKAFDIGATWRWESDLIGEINLTASLAWGSADDNPDDDTDAAFRQTGLQDNNGKYRGVDRFRYYGELFRPELSNLRVATLSVGRRIWSDSSVELAYHRYRQHKASAELRDSRIDLAPTGLDPALGEELNLIIGLEEWVHWEVELIGAVFRSGAAFGASEKQKSYAGILKVDYNF